MAKLGRTRDKVSKNPTRRLIDTKVFGAEVLQITWRDSTVFTQRHMSKKLTLTHVETGPINAIHSHEEVLNPAQIWLKERMNLGH